MLELLKAVIRRTPLSSAYEWLSEKRRSRRLSAHFWEFSTEDLRRVDFYRGFIQPGDLVFDVGANLGNRSKVFQKLEATVVAIEPQAFCADFLQTVFRNSPDFHLVRKALGAAVGQSEMLIGSVDTITSLSPDWIRSVKQSGRFAECKWDGKIKVAVDTLDNLIATYGIPAFIKIDVEGFEDQVVRGLSMPVGALSMEFVPEYIDGALRCIAHLSRLGDCRFQISFDESMQFALPEWVTATEVTDVLKTVPPGAFGDLYARFCGWRRQARAVSTAASPTAE